MKIRFLVYGSLFLLMSALPIAYKVMNANSQQQEFAIRKQKRDWFYTMIRIEWNLAGKSTREEVFWYHYFKGCKYFSLWLDLEQQELQYILNS